MKNIKKFNEHSEEMPAGYTPNAGKFNFDSDNQTITMDTIKESIIEAMMDMNNEEVDVKDPKFAEGIDDLAKMIMVSFQDTLSYLSEHYEGEINDILSLDDGISPFNGPGY
jgi:aromatic ring-opening dioxygenase LigB subunit